MKMKRNEILVLVLTLFLAGGVMSCANKAQQGAVIGALGGAAVGGQVGPDDDRGKSALIGAGLGLALGYIIGNEWDKRDQTQLNDTLENTPSGMTRQWVNPDTGNAYTATPYRPYESDGRVYRDVQIEAVVDGEKQIVHAKAYRRPDGTWELVQQ